ncbi:bacterial Ig-like domain-containing protein, partial [Brotonthovivens ammoniilytica]
MLKRNMRRLLVFALTGSMVFGSVGTLNAQEMVRDDAAVLSENNANSADKETKKSQNDVSKEQTTDNQTEESQNTSDQKTENQKQTTDAANEKTAERNQQSKTQKISNDAQGDLEDTSVTGGDTISKDGIYEIKEGASGILTVAAKNVTLVGLGGTAEKAFHDLTIKCTSEGTKLTLQDVALVGAATGENTIDFTGADNFLYLKGTNLIEKDTNATGYAMIHVGPDAALTIDDASGDSTVGTLYFYKNEQGSGIGGNQQEVNGKITIAGGKIFGKGSKQGAVIGTGARTAGNTPGDIRITGGEINLIANARGALIGGSAGSAGGTAGGKVYVSGGTLTLNVDFSGAAIGGGGFDAGNDAGGGELILSGGSIRTFIDQNAVEANLWPGVATAGVNDSAITAKKVNADGEDMQLFVLDTADISADSYTVKIDGKTYYQGGLHRYGYVNEDKEKNDQIPITTTQSNWKAIEDKSLYLYMTKENHVVNVNGKNYSYTWNEEKGIFEQCNVGSIVTGKGKISVSSQNAKKGDEITVSASPAEGYYLAQVRLNYETADGREVYQVLKKSDGSYKFTMPTDGSVSVAADCISVKWDGTIDLTWYDPNKSVYELQYGAQLAGAAALNNGLFNNFPMTTNTDGNLIPNTDENNHPAGYSESGYNVFKADDKESASTVVVGDAEYLEAYCSTGSTGGNNQATTNDYWYGPENFFEKEIKLTADLDMGGSYTGSKNSRENWSGPLYMPVSGQYSMIPSNGYTKLSASFLGSFDGQGHMVYNIYCNRRGDTFGDNQSIALIGRLGLHDNEADMYDGEVKANVKNVAVDGYIYGNRSIGGIVGKSGRGGEVLIQNCINFAMVENTDSKGVGGIAGAGWNDLTIKDCVNFGYIYTTYKNAGGISGSCEADVYNCYNFGYVGSTKAEQAQALGTNNGGALFDNCYWLTGSSAAVNSPAIYSPSADSTFFEISSPDEYKTAEFLKKLSGSGRGWVLSTESNLISDHLKETLKNVSSLSVDLKSYNALGLAVPRAFTADHAVVKNVTMTGFPETKYVSGQLFNAGDMKIWANYNDGTKEEITDYTITYEKGQDVLTTEDTTVTISGEYEGKAFYYDFAVTVEKSAVEKIQITKQPVNTFYAIGETFDPEGMVVKATYSNGITSEITDYTISKGGILSASDQEVEISYTYEGKTVTDSVAVTVAGSEKPDIETDTATGEQTVVIKTADDLRWFSNQVSIENTDLNARLESNIKMEESEPWYAVGTSASVSTAKVYQGTFDGNGKTITFAVVIKGSGALFGSLGSSAVVKDVTVDSTAEFLSVSGIAGNSEGSIMNCVNKCTIQAGNSRGGIAGTLRGNAVVSGCRNEGEILIGSSTSVNSVGGIAGQVSENAMITGCVNTAPVNAGYNVGGIAGYVSGTNQILYCGNEGAVTAARAASSSSSYAAGGVIGRISSAVVIDNCYNHGTVTGKLARMGGIAGDAGTNTSTKITNCYNTGDVACKESTYAVKIGGIAGNTGKYAVENCYNSGNISTESTNASANTGAITGNSSAIDLFKNNYALEGSADELIGGKTPQAEEAVFKTEAEIAALGDALGAAYKIMNSVPRLVWEEQNADAVIAAITAIGTVTLDSKEQIVSARAAYNQLDAKEQAKVTNYNVLCAAEEKLADYEAADYTDGLIDAIGEVLASSGSKISAARNSYDSLTSVQKDLVKNYSILEAAEKAYGKFAVQETEKLIDAIGKVTLKSRYAIQDARESFDALTEEQQKEVKNINTLISAEREYDLLAAKETVQLIDAIGNQISLESEAAIEAARNSYDALTDKQKEEVSNVDLLLAAEITYGELAVAHTIELIDVIGTVTADSKEAIDAARESYNKLSPENREKVTNSTTLAIAIAAYGKIFAPDYVIKMIDEIGEVKADSKEAIETARAAFEKLSDELKQNVTNISVLIAAEKAYAEMESNAAAVDTLIKAIGDVTADSKKAIKAARAAYDKLGEEEKKLVNSISDLEAAEKAYAQMESNAAAADKLINAIGTVTLDSKEAIEAAKAAYDKLSEEEKKLVTAYETLKEAESSYAELLAPVQNVESLIEAIGTITADSKEAIEAARAAYDALSEQEKGKVSNLSKLEEAEAAYAQME